uniref:Neurotransmitter-gated ion-channel ligand-binding domain-containing protein n=1 Tax=Vespula pensylvanica TaxID=30213 RepID=A0A834U8C3_VESPE|nr:hypothetical protein H0235_009305 [Vespula pensylvanica]
MPPIIGETLRVWFLSALVVHGAVAGNPDAKRLYDDLLSNYNKLVRPVVNTSDVLRVCIKLKLSQLIDVPYYRVSDDSCGRGVGDGGGGEGGFGVRGDVVVVVVVFAIVTKYVHQLNVRQNGSHTWRLAEVLFPLTRSEALGFCPVVGLPVLVNYMERDRVTFRLQAFQFPPHRAVEISTSDFFTTSSFTFPRFHHEEFTTGEKTILKFPYSDLLTGQIQNDARVSRCSKV